MDTKTSHKRTPRIEDEQFLRGLGRYMSDAPLANQTQAAFVRSPHAAADIKSIDTTAAKAVKGVVAVLTGADLKDFHGSVSQHPPLAGRGGAKLIMPFRPSLAAERVSHIGEAVAVVIGETLAAAQDGAEAVAVDYATRDAVVDAKAAVAKGAPQVHPEAPGNIAVDWAGLAPDPEANAKEIERVFASAKYVAKVSLFHNRLNVASMEPRGATASYDAAADLFNLRVCSQGARAMRDSMAGVLKIGNDKIRVTTEEVGGAFGLKTGPYPEYIAILAAAKKIGRPVYWMCGRSEAFLTDNHARDAYSDVELALDEKGKFLALRIRHIGNMGAYIGAVGANIQTINMMRCLPGMYDIKLVDAQTRCVFTNTVVTAPYRGAGRPEASYCIERVVDEAARITGIDPVRLRKRNLISRKAMPYKTRGRHHLRFRRFRSGDRPGPGARRLRGLQGAQEGVEEEGPAARPRRLLRAGAFRRRAGRRPDDGLPRRQHARFDAECAVDRPGPRHHLPAPGRGAARHQVRADQAPSRRQPPRGCGLRVGRLPLGDDGGALDGEDHRGGSRQGQEGRGIGARGRRERHRIQERRVQRGRHRPAHLAVRYGGPRRRR